MTPFFSGRTNWELGENSLSRALNDLRFAGVAVIDLTESNPTQCGFSYPAEAFLRPLSAAENLIYAPQPKGMLKARKAIAAHYALSGVSVDPERLVLTSSTSEAYSFLFRLLFEPGDRVLVPAPSYPLFDYIAGINDVEVDHYQLELAEGQWRIDPAAVESALTTMTRAIILVSPNNPTGSCVKREELEALNRIAASRSLSLIADEVFGDYIFEHYRGRYFSLAGNAEVPTFVLGGLSKAVALPQMKLSWIAVSGPQAFIDACLPRLEVIADTYLSVNTPAQNAAALWLSHGRGIQRQVMERVTANFGMLRGELARSGLGEALTPEGGWYAVLSVPGLTDGEAFALKLLKEEHVYLHPGYFFDFEEEGSFVVSLLPRPEAFRSGVDRLVKALAPL